MGGISNYLKDKIHDAALGQGYTKPAMVYIALYTSAPNASGGGTECTGGGYARKSVTNSSTYWANSSSGVKRNATGIAFTAATGSWGGTVTHWGILDASSGGNLMWWGALDSSFSVYNGSAVTVAANAITLTIS